MSIIYSITSEKGPKIYIGSTISYTKRKIRHTGNDNTCSSRELFDEYGKENCVFTVLEECDVAVRYQRERFHMENTPNLVNRRKTNVSRQEKLDHTKQYNKDHKERHSELSRNYYYRNRDKILERLRNKNKSNPL